MENDLICQTTERWINAGNLLVDLASMECGFEEMNPVRNSNGALNPAGIILKRNPAAVQWGSISNGVKRYRQEVWEYIEYRESLVKWPPMNEQIRGGVL